MEYCFTVSQVNRYVKEYMETDPILRNLWIKGEISNFKHHYSGHLYFTLKDEQGAIKAVMFRNAAQDLKFRPEDGMKVLVQCRVSVYETAGSYQAYVNRMEPDGAGALYTAFEQLKAKLQAEGLFDPEQKKKIPLYPEKIGVITSGTGAAVRDILNILNRRYPLARVTVYPTLVQGSGAASEIAAAIRYFNHTKPADVLIVGRGGGSMEDLWAFNEEKVVRAVYQSEIPVISAVGHETDFTLCDFAADLRAPTPSAAAELATPDQEELKLFFEQTAQRLQMQLKGTLRRKREQLESHSAERTAEKLRRRIEGRTQDCLWTQETLEKGIAGRIAAARGRLELEQARLDGRSPLRILKKGYSVVTRREEAVRKAAELTVGDSLKLMFQDGYVRAQVTEGKETEAVFHGQKTTEF